MRDAMKAASLVLLLLFLCTCKSQPKIVTVGIDGWHSERHLEQACIALQRDSDAQSKMSLKYQASLLSLGGKIKVPCLRDARGLNRDIEGQILTAFASNPHCHGIQVVQGFYGPKDSTQEDIQKYMNATWRLSLDLIPSNETGEITLRDSQWTVSPRSLSGNLGDLEKATTDICRIVKNEGAQ